ncbi:MAG: hypothetical protein IT383_06185 [Deltaproteobacteria bacterium]|nr:hypothetical protein [Deltaproteobacteria bacterium]
MRTLVTALALAPLLLAAGPCFPVATSDPAANCIEQMKVHCAFTYQCCKDPDERARYSGYGLVGHRSESECVEVYGDFCTALMSTVRISAERGRITMDANKVNGCLEARRAALAECDLEAYRADEDDCVEQFEGTVAEGDACVGAHECAGDATCAIDYDNDGEPESVDEEMAVPQGECTDPPGEGDSCAEDDCAEDLYCDDEDICREPPGAGEPCPDFFCADGYDCDDSDGDFEYTCEPEEEEEEPAEDYDYCEG